MRYTAFLTGAILLVALNATAQISPANSAQAGNSSLVALSEPFTNPFTLPGATAPDTGNHWHRHRVESKSGTATRSPKRLRDLFLASIYRL